MNSFENMALFMKTAAQQWDCHINATVCSGTSCVVPPLDPKAKGKLALRVIMAVVLAFVMFSMGCTVEMHKLLGHLRRPWGIGIGFLSQFGIMPLTGFIMSLAFNVAPLYAVVIIIMGCCPGGTGSNVVAYLLDGDMDLSISMTTCSTVMALGMMPLCLLIYTSLWVSPDTIQIPYDTIGINLVAFIIPVAIGMCVKWKWPKKSEIIIKIGSTVGCVLFIVMALAGGMVYSSSWNMDREIWIIGVTFPFIGYGLGFILACFVGHRWFRCRTIALETGMQNSQLCNAIVQLSFSVEEVDVIFAFSLIYTIFQIVGAILMVVGYQIYKRKCGGGPSEDSEVPSLDGEVETGKSKSSGLENRSFESKDDKNQTQF